jgi:hypothetical protein
MQIARQFYFFASANGLGPNLGASAGLHLRQAIHFAGALMS